MLSPYGNGTLQRFLSKTGLFARFPPHASQRDGSWPCRGDL